jgi:RHS repeat-associated protein
VLFSNYSFNSKEKDDEVYGDGNFQDYGMRCNDNRLGRFLSVDPLSGSFPWYTPYQFAGNMPIIAIDLDGEEEQIVNMSYDDKGRVTLITVAQFVEKDGKLYENNIKNDCKDVTEKNVMVIHKYPNKPDKITYEDKLTKEQQDVISNHMIRNDDIKPPTRFAWGKYKGDDITEGKIQVGSKKFDYPSITKGLTHPSFKVNGGKANDAFLISSYWDVTYLPGKNALNAPQSKNGDLSAALVPEMDNFVKQLKASGAKSVDITIVLGKSNPNGAYTQAAMETAAKRAAESITEYLKTKIPGLKTNTVSSKYDSNSKTNKIDLKAK